MNLGDERYTRLALLAKINFASGRTLFDALRDMKALNESSNTPPLDNKELCLIAEATLAARLKDDNRPQTSAEYRSSPQPLNSVHKIPQSATERPQGVRTASAIPYENEGEIIKAGFELLPVSVVVDKFLQTVTGPFNVNDIFKYAGGIRERSHKDAVYKSLRRRVKNKIIERIRNKNGWYRILDYVVPKLSITPGEKASYPLWLPFGLHHMVKIHPKSVILIAGEPNSGKTAILLNITKRNLENRMLQSYYNSNEFDISLMECPINYFTSEMSGDEFGERLHNFGMPQGYWDIFSGHIYERSFDFQDAIKVIKAAPDALNIIDYLEIHEEFYKIGQSIMDIFEALNKGVAIIALQKNKGNDLGVGGNATIQKARLALSLFNNAPYGHICKIIKAKNCIPTGVTHDWKELDFHIGGGAGLKAVSDWRHVRTVKDREQINKDHASGKFADDGEED